MSIVIHNKTGNLYILKVLFAKNATNGKEGEVYAVYKRPFNKQTFVRRTGEFSMKFTHWREWDFKNKRGKA
ncbi:hypothetical protein KAR91_52250 [Candidatus Pacearchaeota archaeon]|nr:hypothetical protein [Candidatus Pacearchaeota archaeon]